jgi:hypothetical protein
MRPGGGGPRLTVQREIIPQNVVGMKPKMGAIMIGANGVI